MICNNNHEIEMTFNSFYYNKSRCKFCSYKTKKLNIENVKQILLDHDLELLEFNEYPLLTIKCKNNHITKFRFDRIYEGRGCKICSLKNGALKRSGNKNGSWIIDRSIVNSNYTYKFTSKLFRKRILEEQKNLCLL